MPVSTTTKTKPGWRWQMPQKMSCATSSPMPRGESEMNASRTPGVGSKRRAACMPRGPWMWKESGIETASSALHSGSHTGSL